jgi:hypothetical protein
MQTRLFLLAAALPALAATGSAQIQTLLLEGDSVAGVGNVTVVRNIALNDNGDWLAEVRTDNPSNAVDVCVLKNGQLFLREGQALQQPAGATISNFDAMTIDNQGNTAMNLTLGGVPAAQNTAIYWNDKLVLQAGATAGAAAFGAGTVYKEFRECQINNANQIMVVCTVDDPGITGPDERAIVILDVDAQGNLVGETKVVVEGDTIASTAQPFIETSTFAHHFGFNDLGQVMYYGRCDTGNGGNDDYVMLDQLAIVEENLPSFIAGRNWGSTNTPECDVNNNGDWALAAILSGSTTDEQIIFKNGVKLVQEGDPVPGMPAFAFQSFLSAPVEIGDNGDVVWYGDWDDANTAQDSGIFINQTLVVQEGVTQVGTNVISKLVGLVDGFHLSYSGNLLMFEGELDNGLAGVFRIASGEPGQATCFGDGTGFLCPCGNFGGTAEGCMNSMAMGSKLAAIGSASLSSSSLNFTASQMPAGRIAMLVSGTTAATNIFGDGIGCASTFSYHGAKLTSGSGTAAWGAAAFAGAGYAAGQTVTFQVLYRDPVGGICGTGYNSTSGYQVTFAQ